MGGDKIVPSLEAKPSVYVLADGTSMSALPPGLTYELVVHLGAAWQRAGAQAAASWRRARTPGARARSTTR